MKTAAASKNEDEENEGSADDMSSDSDAPLSKRAKISGCDGDKPKKRKRRSERNS